MNAVAVDIADAVTAVLNAATLSQSFIAVRGYVPILELEELDALSINVVPGSILTTLIDRATHTLNDYETLIEINKAVEKRTNEETDPYMRLAEEIMTLFLGLPLTGYTKAACVTAENKPVFEKDRMYKFGLFTTVVTLTFRLGR